MSHIGSTSRFNTGLKKRIQQGQIFKSKQRAFQFDDDQTDSGSFCKFNTNTETPSYISETQISKTPKPRQESRNSHLSSNLNIGMSPNIMYKKHRKDTRGRGFQYNSYAQPSMVPEAITMNDISVPSPIASAQAPPKHQYIQTPIPTMDKQLSDTQIKDLLQNVNLDNSLLGLACNDDDLIYKMKSTIEYQREVGTKRENLLKAITANVKHIAVLNQSNSAELKVTKERITMLSDWNEKLQVENARLTKENEIALADQQRLAEKREEMAKMIIESQANATEIEALYDTQKTQEEQYEKLNVEITVLVTEKLTLKKEYDRLENNHRKLKKDLQEYRVKLNLVQDEVHAATKQNSDYRGHILANENKFTTLANEIKDLQKHIDVKNEVLEDAKYQATLYEAQIKKLNEELMESMDSESFDDVREKQAAVKKTMEAEFMKEKISSLKGDIKLKELEMAQNIKRVESNLQFLKDANQLLKNDYDNLQDKFNKHVKESNNLYLSLKEDMEAQNAKLMRLQLFQDDSNEIMTKVKEDADAEIKKAKDDIANEIRSLKNDRDDWKMSAQDLKTDIAKMESTTKLLQIELEQKMMAIVQKEEEDDETNKIKEKRAESPEKENKKEDEGQVKKPAPVASKATKKKLNIKNKQ